MSPPRYILPVIIASQLCCTSLWFATNGVMESLIAAHELPPSALGHLTTAVQVGFISGTLVFALLMIADRFAPARVFFVSGLLAALCNLVITWGALDMNSLFALRFGCGFFLAGIYPVGMKIASDYFKEGLGTSLSYLVGALVLGTALPHLLSNVSATYPWQYVLYATSVLAVVGGGMLWMLVPNGPYHTAGTRLQLTAAITIFKNAEFRKAALGYFGHMWELYAFWAFVPLFLAGYQQLHPDLSLKIPLLSFLIIGAGAIGCIIGGQLAPNYGNRTIARWAILGSGLCCLSSPLFFELSLWGLVVLLIIWGMLVIADSPLFSTLVAHNAPSALKGTGLTIVNCLGFAITIVSIQLLTYISELISLRYLFLLLAIGPIFGFWVTRKK